MAPDSRPQRGPMQGATPGPPSRDGSPSGRSAAPAIPWVLRAVLSSHVVRAAAAPPGQGRPVGSVVAHRVSTARTGDGPKPPQPPRNVHPATELPLVCPGTESHTSGPETHTSAAVKVTLRGLPELPKQGTVEHGLSHIPREFHDVFTVEVVGPAPAGRP